MSNKRIVSIGIITYLNPNGFKKLLDSIIKQNYNEALYEIRLIFVDNDCTGKNQAVIDQYPSIPFPWVFILEPNKGIPFARNAVVREALKQKVDALMFVDDDEFAPEYWLQNMINTWQESGADGVCGNVIPVYPEGTPEWFVKLGMFDKFSDENGLRYKHLDETTKVFTCNTLVDKRVIEKLGPTFDPIFKGSGSDDKLYFLRAMSAGFKFVWSDKSELYEDIPEFRINYSWVFKRSYRTSAGRSISSKQFNLPMSTHVKNIILGFKKIFYGSLTLIYGLISFDSLQKAKGLQTLGVGLGMIFGYLGLDYNEYRKHYREQYPINQHKDKAS